MILEDLPFTIDKKLLEDACRFGGHRTKTDAIDAALAEYVRRCRQNRILKLFGTIDFDPAYDYKAERRRKRM